MSDILQRLDLNLLVPLSTLLREKSVSGAARKLGLSQPALSTSLARLRRHFDDELLTRRGNTHELTPFAERIQDQITLALQETRRVFDAQATWNPETSHREFLVYGSDYSITSVGAFASRLVAQRAPNVSLKFELNTPHIVEAPDLSLRTADGLLIPHGHISGAHCTDLWEDEWVILTDKNHPTIGEKITLEDLSSNPWVTTYNSKRSGTALFHQMRAMGIEPTIAVAHQSFLSVPYFVEGTARLGLVHRSMASTYPNIHQLRIHQPPMRVLPIKNAFWWHPSHAKDPGHHWLRSIFIEAAAQLTPA